MIGSFTRQGHQVHAVVHQSGPQGWPGNNGAVRVVPVPVVHWDPVNSLTKRLTRRSKSTSARLVSEAIRGIPHPLQDPRHNPLRLHRWWVSAALGILECDVDVVWAADLNALPAGVWAAEAAGLPLVFDSHEIGYELDYVPEVFRSVWRALASDFIPQADAVLVVTPDFLPLYSAFGVENMRVIPNLADGPEPYPRRRLRSSLGVADDALVAVHVGSVVENREPGLGVAALSHLPNLHFAFVGAISAAMGADLRGKAAELGVGSRLHLLGSVPSAQVSDYIRDADVSCALYSPERSLNLKCARPNKLYESLAADMPMVAPAGTSVGEFLVSNGFGGVFQDGDPADLARAIEVAASRHPRSMRTDIRREYCWEANDPAIADALQVAVESSVRTRKDLSAVQSAELHSKPREAATAGHSPKVLRRAKGMFQRVRSRSRLDA
ncbi:MAG: glycosyltransferase [Candidatus Nanopelagicales bacterium]|nr:glycosyltransferase [Candidatus Nanopelagicales bacterium]MDZ4250178.1 glycosyltransferase [Candidatus Nanopelagicales bacterium]